MLSRPKGGGTRRQKVFVMKIIFVISGLANGGAEREVVAYADALAEMGNEVHIVCLWRDETDYVPSEKVVVHRWRFGSVIRILHLRVGYNLPGWIVRLRALRGDVIIPFCLPPEFYPLCFWPAVLFSRTRLLYTVRNNEEKKSPGRLGRLFKRFAWFLADGIWTQTEDQRVFFPEKMQKKIFVAPNILDRRFLDIRRQERGKVSRFISVGRIHAQKNHKMLVRAFAKMIERTGDQDSTLSIYGKTADGYRAVEEELRALIHELRLKGRVFLPGRVSDIESKYEQADAFVFSSDYEGCPNALMEAMAAGLPCISTDCPTGPSTIIDSGSNGILVPVGDEDAMSRAVESLIRDPRRAGELGAAAKQRMEEWGSAQELAEKLLSHLKEICS